MPVEVSLARHQLCRSSSEVIAAEVRQSLIPRRGLRKACVEYLTGVLPEDSLSQEPQDAIEKSILPNVDGRHTGPCGYDFCLIERRKKKVVTLPKSKKIKAALNRPFRAITWALAPVKPILLQRF